MKIWFPLVATGSGSDVYTNRLAESLKKSGLDSTITYFPKYFELVPSLLAKYPPPPGTSIIHTNSWYAFAFCGSGIPVVATVHSPTLNPVFTPYKSIPQKLYHQYFVKRNERLSIRNAALVTAVSNFTRLTTESVHAIYNIKAIYNYVDTEYFRPETRSPYTTDRPFRLLFVGNYRYLKGADLLEPIMRSLGSGFALTATGGHRGGPFKPKANNNIHLVRRLDGCDLIKAYQNADALLFPSRMEGFGLVALEAMACGLPVIASNNSSIPEVVENKRTGILCDTGKVESFVDACLTLRRNPMLLSEYGYNARERAVQYFSEDRIIKKYIELYKSALL